MVVKILGLSEIPKPVDATDALALAICHHWRGVGNQKQIAALSKAAAFKQALLKAKAN